VPAGALIGFVHLGDAGERGEIRDNREAVSGVLQSREEPGGVVGDAGEL